MADDRLSRIEDKIDKLADHVGSIDTTLAAQHVVLQEHIRRTNLLEDEVRPLKERDTMLRGALRVAGAVALLAATSEGIVQTILFIKGLHKW